MSMAPGMNSLMNMLMLNSMGMSMNMNSLTNLLMTDHMGMIMSLMLMTGILTAHMPMTMAMIIAMMMTYKFNITKHKRLAEAAVKAVLQAFLFCPINFAGNLWQAIVVVFY